MPTRSASETFTWGRDYPHLEGTWPFSAEALRATFSGMKTEDVRMILGDNGVRCYGLDSAYLRTVADRIGPEPAAVAEDLEATPADAWSWAFRDRDDNKGGKRIGDPTNPPAVDSAGYLAQVVRFVSARAGQGRVVRSTGL